MEAAPAAARRARAFHWPLEFPDVMQRGGFDVTIGNPPFLNAIEGSLSKIEKNFLAIRSPILGGTADLAFHFLVLADRITRPQYPISFIQPISILASPAASDLRLQLNSKRSVSHIHDYSAIKVFPDAATYICIITLGAGNSAKVSIHTELGIEKTSGTFASDNWWKETQQWRGIVSGEDEVGQRIDSIFIVQASMTTGDAYDVKPFLKSDPDATTYRLVTTGLIDPGAIHWGNNPCRFLKDDYDYPCINPSPALSKSLKKRLQNSKRPKILIAGLANRIEAAIDEYGKYIGAVSTFSIFDPDDNIDRLRSLCEWLNSDAATKRLIAEQGASSVSGNYMTIKKKAIESLKITNSI